MRLYVPNCGVRFPLRNLKQIPLELQDLNLRSGFQAETAPERSYSLSFATDVDLTPNPAAVFSRQFYLSAFLAYEPFGRARLHTVGRVPVSQRLRYAPV